MTPLGNLTSQARFIRTLRDIGPRRLQRRVRYELRQRLSSYLPPDAASWLVGASLPGPPWRTDLQCLEVESSLNGPRATSATEPRSIRFSFLNQQRDLLWPLCWNDPDWPRLWQFHLHYFDWAREWLELALVAGRWSEGKSALKLIIDQWISANPLGRGDGWHSYTLSLRIRNWVWLFRTAPHLVSQGRLQSLWQQLCWLQSHPESCHGGNHWLENLSALAIGSLQFEGPKAEAMQHRSLKLLKRELASQVLSDGGHQERSAAYHLLMLDRLVELGCVLTATRGTSPDWLNQSIDAMATWAVVARLEGGHCPPFNDSAKDAAPPLDEVVAFATSFCSKKLVGALSPTGWPLSPLRCNLLNAAAVVKRDLPRTNPLPSISDELVQDLPETGWMFVRPGHGWELVFKCGVPCPPHLPAHVHSDQLSFELMHHGDWVLSEAGTSIYGNGPQRAFERSGAAHNSLQLGLPNSDGDVDWFEPVEVWGAFRAGRKCKPRQRDCGALPAGGWFVAGGHDGFDALGASHLRRIEVSDVTSSDLHLKILDTVNTQTSLCFRQWWHLAPELPKTVLDGLIFDLSNAEQIQADWTKTTFAQGFGKREMRHSFCIGGLLPPGEHRLRVNLPVFAPIPSLPI